MSDFQLPSNPADREKLLSAAKELRDSRYRVLHEQSFQKDVLARIEEEMGVKKSDMRGIADEFTDEKASKSIEKFEVFVDAVKILRGSNRQND